jgi:hypothetical protein
VVAALVVDRSEPRSLEPGALEPMVRLRRAPRTEPPFEFEDEAPDPSAVERPAARRPGAAAGSDPGAGSGPRAWSGAAAGSDPGAWSGAGAVGAVGAGGPSAVQCVARRYVNLCLEVLGGFRPLGHLRRLTTPTMFDVLPDELSVAPHPSARIRLRQLRVCQPRDGVAEAVAVLGQGGQAWAMTLRLERRQADWLCTHLSML